MKGRGKNEKGGRKGMGREGVEEKRGSKALKAAGGIQTGRKGKKGGREREEEREERGGEEGGKEI